MGEVSRQGLELLADLDKLVVLLVASAFVSGFGLVALNVISAAFAKVNTGTQPLGGGPQIRVWAHRGVEPDRIRDELQFYVEMLGFLLGLYVAMFLAGVVAEGVLQVAKGTVNFAAEGEISRACYRSKVQWFVCAVGLWLSSHMKELNWILSLFVVKHVLLQVAFIGLWSLMIVGIVKMLKGRLSLTAHDV